MNRLWRRIAAYPIAVIASGMVLVVAMLAVTVFSTPDPQHAPPSQSVAEPAQSNAPADIPEPTRPSSGQQGVATVPAPRADVLPGEEGVDTAPTQAFDLDRVVVVLAELELDADGNLIVNESILPGLNEAFLSTKKPLSQAQVEELQLIVKTGLEGPAGEQAADIVERFSRYSNAYRETASSLQVHQARPDILAGYLEQLEIMRRAHLGDELAGALFDREEELPRYTIESIRVEQNPDLTEQERQALRQEFTRKVESLLAEDAQAGEP